MMWDKKIKFSSGRDKLTAPHKAPYSIYMGGKHSDLGDALGLIVLYALAMGLIAVPFKWFHLTNTNFTVSAQSESKK